jgi:hypothetical protein
MVEEAYALPPIAYATHYVDLFVEIATLKAANAADVANVVVATTKAKAEDKDENEDRENRRDKV